jgi:hypothetical protein
MEPISPLIWSLAFSAQFSRGVGPWPMLPGWKMGVQNKGWTVQWNQVGRSSNLIFQKGSQRLSIGKWSNESWLNGGWKVKKLEGEFWFDLSKQKLSTQWVYTLPNRRIHLNTHPALGVRVGYVAPRLQVELGNRWRVQWLLQAPNVRATISGGWNENSVYGAELQWRKVHVNYRTTLGEFGQWSVHTQPFKGSNLSMNASKDRWRIQSNQRFSMNPGRPKSGTYLESSVFVHSRGSGFLLGAGNNKHRLYGSTGVELGRGYPFELGWQTLGKWGQMGVCQIQLTAQKQESWSWHLRLNQSIRLGNSQSNTLSRSKPAALQIISQIEEQDRPHQFLMVLKHLSTGNTIRFLLEGNSVRREWVPEGDYIIQFMGPEDWEYQCSVDRITASKGDVGKKVVVLAKSIKYKEMN